MSTTEREKLEKLYGVFSEAATTKGRWAHIEPETCGEVADVLGKQIEGGDDDKSEWTSIFLNAGRVRYEVRAKVHQRQQITVID